MVRAAKGSCGGSSHFRLEHRELAAHECIAVSSQRQAVLWLELLDLAAVHALPGALMAHLAEVSP